MIVTINLSDLHYVENLISKETVNNIKNKIEGIEYESRDDEFYNLLSLDINVIPHFSVEQKIECNCNSENVINFEDMCVEEISSDDDILYLELRKDLECNCSIIFKTTTDRKQFDRILDVIFADPSLLEASNRLIYLDEDFEIV